MIENWKQTLADSVIRPQSIALREKLLDRALIWPTNTTNNNFTKQANFAPNNVVEIETDLQFGPSRNVDFRFTAPPLRQFELITSVSKKFDENDKKNRKQSILLNKSSRKFKNERKMLPENVEGIMHRESKKLLESEFRPSVEFWTEYFQMPIKTEHGNNEAKLIAINQPETFLGNENQQYVNSRLVNSGKIAKPISSTHEAEDDSDDSDLIMNLESNYRNLLMPKPTTRSNTIQFINGISKRMKYDNQKKTEYLNFNSKNLCPIDDVVNSQPWDPMSINAQSEKIWRSGYQIPKISSSRRFPVLASQYELNYQQNPTSSDAVSVLQESANQFFTPITPINSLFNNSIQVSPSVLNNPWIPNRATTINQSRHMFNDYKISARPIYTGYTESFQPVIPLSSVASIPQTNPSFNEFKVYNRLPLLSTLKTIKSNYHKTTETGDYNNREQQKDSRTHLEKEYPINRELKISGTVMDLMENRRQYPIH